MGASGESKGESEESNTYIQAHASQMQPSIRASSYQPSIRTCSILWAYGEHTRILHINTQNIQRSEQEGYHIKIERERERKKETQSMGKTERNRERPSKATSAYTN